MSDNEKYKLLIVDDEEFFCKLVLAKLKDEYEVGYVNDGNAALEKIKHFKPDIFLIDNIMPKLSGIELVKILRKTTEFISTPIIMITAKDTIKDKIQSFAVGVDDYVTKPFNFLELNARIKSLLRRSKEAIYSHSIFKNLDNSTLINELDLFKNDLKSASMIQLNLMPSHFPENEYFEFGAKMIPANYVGGDFYDFISLDSDRVVICVGDVSGKGISAAFLMIMIRTIIRTLLSEKLPLISICRRINSMLIKEVGMGKFVTMFIGILNMRTCCFESYVNAGHLPPYVLNNKNGNFEIKLLDSTGPFLGAFPSIEIAAESFQFEPGDLLTIYTDGAIELESNGKVIFSDKILLDYLKKLYHLSPQEIIENIMDKLDSFSMTFTKKDDVTFLLAKVKN